MITPKVDLPSETDKTLLFIKLGKALFMIWLLQLRVIKNGQGQLGWSLVRGGQGGKRWSRSKGIKSGQGCQRCSKMNSDGQCG